MLSLTLAAMPAIAAVPEASVLRGDGPWAGAWTVQSGGLDLLVVL